MKETVLITGSGLIARQLGKKLEENNFNVRYLSRSKKDSNYVVWDIHQKYIEPGAFNEVQHIIHLAGAGITEKRWTTNRKKELILSRVDGIELIKENLKRDRIKLNTFISASAIGYYGTETTEQIYSEQSDHGSDFISELCIQWEQMTGSLSQINPDCRTVSLRIGIVLSKRGGALEKMVKPIRFLAGAPLGSGKQYMPWIHIDDLCNMILYCLSNLQMKGVYNAVAPEHINNSFFTKAIAKQIHKPLIMPNIPGFILQLIFGEMSKILLNGSRVSSQKIIKSGFEFKFKAISMALEDLL